MARALVVGDSERTVLLTRSLVEDGILVRIVTFDPRRIAVIEDAGAEACVADPERLSTITQTLDGASAACWLLGSVGSDSGRLHDLHDSLLRAFLLETVDSPVRGFVYEAAGSVPAELLAHGAKIARSVAGANAIPLRILDANPDDLASWLAQAKGALRELLSH